MCFSYRGIALVWHKRLPLATVPAVYLGAAKALTPQQLLVLISVRQRLRGKISSLPPRALKPCKLPGCAAMLSA
jgi:hypothetical protein